MPATFARADRATGPEHLHDETESQKHLGRIAGFYSIQKSRGTMSVPSYATSSPRCKACSTVVSTCGSRSGRENVRFEYAHEAGPDLISSST